MMGNKKCIICYTQIAAVDFNSKNTSLKGDTALNRQLIVIFLLKKFFKTSQATCLQFLKKYGNPSEWINWCDSCSFLVEKVKCVMDQTILLAKQVESLQVELINAVHVSEKQCQETPRNGEEQELGWGATEVIRLNFTQKKSQLGRLDVEDSTTEIKIETFDCVNIFDDDDARYNVTSDCSDDVPSTNLQEKDNLVPKSEVLTTSEVKQKGDPKRRKSFTGSDDDLDSSSDKVNDDISNKNDGDADYSGLDSEDTDSSSVSEDKVPKKRSSRISNRNSHKARKEKNFKCEKCDRAYASIYILKDHFIAVHGQLPITCEKCGEKMLNDAELKKHIERLHYVSDDSIACPKCGKLFRGNFRSGSLRKHCQREHPSEVDKLLPPMRCSPRVVSDDNSTSCKVCGKVLLVSTLRAHCRKFHPDKVSELFSKKGQSLFCDVCPKKFKNQLLLKLHYEKKHPEDFKSKYRDQSIVFPCSYCQFKTVNKKYLEFHIAKHEGRDFCENGESIYSSKINTDASEKKKFVCELCSALYGRRGALKEHFVNVHGELPFSCEKCFAKMVNEDEFTEHNENLHTETAFPCPTCIDTYFKSRRLLKMHFEKKHLNESRELQIPRKKAESIVPTPEEMVTCEKCEVICAHAGALRQHYRKHHPEFYAQLLLIKSNKTCDICDVKFVTRRDLKSHFEKEHPKEFKLRFYTPVLNKFHVCHLCPFKTKSKWSLQGHIKKHDCDRPYICDLCGFTFKNNQMLKHHRHSKHYEELGLQPYKCQICGKMFESPMYLQTHTKEHLGQFKYHCSLCNRGFSIRSALRLHLLRHKGEKPELCAECGKSFLTNYSLQAHIKRVHSNRQKSIHCPKCKKSFYCRGMLKRHDQGVHSDGIKPHECQICHKKFPVRNYLYIHMRSHTKRGETFGKTSEKEKPKQ